LNGNNVLSGNNGNNVLNGNMNGNNVLNGNNGNNVLNGNNGNNVLNGNMNGNMNENILDNRGGNNNLNHRINNNNNFVRHMNSSVKDMPLLLIILVIVICTLPAVTIAVRCNPKYPIIMGIVAFLFDRLYLFQHVVRAFYLKEKNFCTSVYKK